MAKVNFVGATLRLKYVAGHNAQNEPMFTTKTYRNLSGSHTAEDRQHCKTRNNRFILRRESYDTSFRAAI
ncbi:DUF1659 domain-containing protein [Lysinibacillus sp. RC79]|uniref:DUF1659 domain-containing protein n=1 Tax=Lysinibacillus sp. RC79 TaxID=3156296 RepID=UPI0035154DF6